MEVVYLEKGERRPADVKLLIECKRGLRRREISDGPEGSTIRVRTEELEAILADLERQGAKKVYVRKH